MLSFTKISEIESRLPPLAGSSCGRAASISRGTEAKLGSLKSIDHDRDSVSSTERPSKTRKLEGFQESCWVRETLDEIDGGDKEHLIFILPNVSMKLVSDSGNGNIVDSAQGHVYLTTHRMLFVSPCDSQDLVIDALCITLHAMTSDPETSVYCQLLPNSLKNSSGTSSVISDDVECGEHDEEYRCTDDHEYAESDYFEGPVEIFFSPLSRDVVHCNDNANLDQEQKVKLCEEFFKALGTLATLNPIHEDEEEENFAPGFGLYESAELDDYVCRLNKSAEDEGATEEERDAMLERLDAVLTVNSDYEHNLSTRDDRFDDADESEGLL
jgi:hypothetical protein